MSQTQIQSLTAFFKENVPPRAMKSFDSVLDEMKFIPAAKDYGLGQYRQAVTHHQTAQNALSRRDNTRVTTATPQ